MNKLNTGKASILAMTAVLAVGAFLLGRAVTTPKNVNAMGTAPCYGDCPSHSFSDSHYIYTDKVVDEAQHYIYADKVLDHAGYYTCSNGWTLDGNQCKQWVDTTYKCPTDASLYIYNSNQDGLTCKWQGSGTHYHKYAKQIVDVDGHWDTKDADYHNPTYTCPNGYQDNPGGQPKACRKLVPTTFKCPDGYTDHNGDCRKTETFGPITVQYNKDDSDPHKCHRPTAVSLGVPSWAESDFNTQLSEWQDNTNIITCPTPPPSPIACVGDWDYTDVCSKSCGGGFLQQVFNIYTPSSDGGTPCTNNQGDTRWSTSPSDSCNTDACEVQCPENATYNADNRACECNGGYHAVDGNGNPVAIDGVEYSCAPDATQTPTPTPNGGDNNSSSGGSSNAPTCNDTKPGTPTILSAVQNGTNTTLTWSSVPNATYYSVVYGDIPGTFNYGAANVGNVTTYTIHDLQIGTVYHYGVIAVNNCMPGDPGTFNGGTGGQQVLGASTMGGTGSFEENLYLAIMAIGGIITTLGVKNFKKGYKVA